MARQIVETVVSDLSGETIRSGEVWTMELLPPAGRRSRYRLDLSQAEALDFASKGTEVKLRGRPPGSRNRPKAQ
jgi:hypothetical protein